MKKTKTFAQRAKDIMKRYPRHEWDKIERKDMMAELEELKQEQEAFKAAMEANEPREDNEMGEVEDFDPGGPLPFEYNDYGTASVGDLNKTSFGGKQYRPTTTSFLPFAISGAASAIGDIAGLSNLKKNMVDNVTLPRVSPQYMSLQPEREALRRDMNTTRNIMLRNSRDASGAANAYANQVAGLSSLSDVYGTQMGRSYMNEANTNVQLANQAAFRNAEAGSRESMYNAELRNSIAGARAPYLSSIYNTVPNMLKDYRQQVNDTNMVNTMGKDYGYYEDATPEQSYLSRLRNQMFGRQKYILPRLHPNIID